MDLVLLGAVDGPQKAQRSVLVKETLAVVEPS
jgi:hypothetical protein